MRIDVLWATCKTGRIHTAQWDGAKVEYLQEGLVPGDNGLLIRYGLQCHDCEKHWFATPGDRIEAISEFADILKHLSTVPTKGEMDAVVISTAYGKPASS